MPDEEAVRMAERIGPDRVITLAGGTHAPMRVLPEATTAALLRALAED
jgi:L-ascorbate metabolism protein UlaG (beta-lactamase superfamily)